MPRSAVLTGRTTARDRAHQRQRLDRAFVAEPEPHDAIEAWLASAALPVEGTALARLDLGRFLADTSSIALPPHERLRQLAVFLDARVRDHAALDRIYAASLRLAPDAWATWHSRSITAKAVALDSEGRRADRWRALSRRGLDHAVALAPDDLYVRYSQGKWAYLLGGGAGEALPLFDRALEIDPVDGWSLLYRAHCLHDLSRWADAVRAYDAVPLGTFTGNSAWLVDLVLECVSFCRLRDGDRVGALAGFERLVDRLEKVSPRAPSLALSHLREATRTAFEAELGTRVDAL